MVNVASFVPSATKLLLKQVNWFWCSLVYSKRIMWQPCGTIEMLWGGLKSPQSKKHSGVHSANMQMILSWTPLFYSVNPHPTSILMMRQHQIHSHMHQQRRVPSVCQNVVLGCTLIESQTSLKVKVKGEGRHIEKHSQSFWWVDSRLQEKRPNAMSHRGIMT